MLTGLSFKETFKYSLKDDDGEIKTIFHLGSIPSSARTDFMSDCMNDQNQLDQKAIIRNANEIFTLGVKKIENLLIDEVAQTVEKIDESILLALGVDTIAEVAMKIFEINFVQAKERKK